MKCRCAPCRWDIRRRMMRLGTAAALLLFALRPVLAADTDFRLHSPPSAGNNWFIGAMGNSEPRQFSFALDFLGDGSYRMTSIADGKNAARYASDHAVRSQTVEAGSNVKIALAPGGGWVARLEVIQYVLS